MPTQPSSPPPLPPPGRPPWAALAALLLVSAAYESVFLYRGLNWLDEAWPLYAAMRLHDGGVLYRDVLWVFPPGHLWTAWLAWWLDPPGFVFTRVVYALFDVALVAASWLLGRRLMPEPFAFLGALLVAVAAPESHSFQLLFGFRYLVIPVLALLALARRLDGGSPGWMWLAGALVGLSLTFRPTPAFAAACGVAAALLASHRRWQDWLGDGLRFAAALAIVVAPSIAWFHHSVGLERLWQELVTHPYTMVEAQSLDPPALFFPDLGNRIEIRKAFVALKFRAIWGLYGVYLVGLLAVGWRAFRRGERFRHGLLVAFAVFGAVFFARSLGRSDRPHLDSAIPPVCVLFAHALWLGFDRVWPPAGRRRRAAATALAAVTALAWILLNETDTVVFRPGPLVPLRALDRRIATGPPEEAHGIDRTVELIRLYTEPDETILNLSPSPVFHVLTGRTGPGFFDIVMPGTFLRGEDEAWFLERLKADPPAVVIGPGRVFDERPEHRLGAVAPRLTEWVRATYVRAPGQQNAFIVLVRRDRLEERRPQSR